MKNITVKEIDEAISNIEERASSYGNPLPESAIEFIPKADSIALAALRAERERLNPAPLSLSELLSMSNDPVWIVEWSDDQRARVGHWELYADARDFLKSRSELFYGDGDTRLQRLSWFAYRTKPERGEMK